jgi:PD-(D/E)XK nuclease family transposase
MDLAIVLTFSSFATWIHPPKIVDLFRFYQTMGGSPLRFKVTFGNESDTRFLKKALQALINSSVPIKDVTFIQNEMKGLTIDSRSGIYDIACTDENDNHFIVEMQLSDYPEFIQRMNGVARAILCLVSFQYVCKKRKIHV